jgi:RNA polymerase sigma-70 factor, ECF subfamily
MKMVPAGTAEREAVVRFEEFSDAEYERLLRALLVVCRDRTEAEDLAQEAMARAFERWERFTAAASPVAYVYAIAFNLHRSALRRARRALRRGADTPNARDPSTSTEDRLDVIRALRSLPLPQREALLLTHWLGMTAEETGAALGIAPESVRGRVHRARITLRDRLGDDALHD